jgi:hypothetical protein
VGGAELAACAGAYTECSTLCSVASVHKSARGAWQWCSILLLSLRCCTLQVLQLLQRQPRLLRSCNRLRDKLEGLQQLLLLPSGAGAGRAAPTGDGVVPSAGTGVCSSEVAQLVRLEPALLCYSTRTLRAKFEAMVAVSGLHPSAVAAAVCAQPRLLLNQTV